MRRIFFIITVVVFNAQLGLAQNLVLNPSFENFIICPNGIGNFNVVYDWTNPIEAGFYHPSPDFFHECANGNSAGVPINVWGYQHAQHGSAYAGGYSFLKNYPDFREYIEGTLDSALQQGVEYEVSFWVSLGDTCNLYVPEIGLYFSDTLVKPMNPNSFFMPFTPQLVNTTMTLNDTSSWQKLSWTYTASGGERYFTIGNYSDSLIYSTLDTTRLDVAYYYIDNVYIGPPLMSTNTSVETAAKKVEIYPNPTIQSITMDWQMEAGEKGQLFIFNALGQLVRQESIQGKEGQKQIDLTGFYPGTYFCKLYFDDQEVHQEKLIIIE